jgi:hypothetical protein
MKHFDENWKECARQAGRTPPRDESAPFGFARRVVARSLHAGSAASVEDAWERLAPRWLAVALAVLAFCAAIEMPHLREMHPLNPGVENTIAQLLWRL